MNNNFRKLGIIAGGGNIPQKLISQCIQQNRDFVVLAIEGNAEKNLFDGYNVEHKWIRIGQAGSGFQYFAKQGVKDVDKSPNYTSNNTLGNRKRTGIKWDKPNTEQFKLNFHCSLINGKASTGFVIRNDQARVISMRGEQVHCATVIGTEAYAASRGITEAIKLNIKDLIIEGDNICVINALNGMWGCPWEEYMLILDARL